MNYFCCQQLLTIILFPVKYLYLVVVTFWLVEDDAALHVDVGFLLRSVVDALACADGVVVGMDDEALTGWVKLGLLYLVAQVTGWFERYL